MADAWCGSGRKGALPLLEETPQTEVRASSSSFVTSMLSSEGEEEYVSKTVHFHEDYILLFIAPLNLQYEANLSPILQARYILFIL